MSTETATATESPPEPDQAGSEPENAPNGDAETEPRERDDQGRLLSREAANYRRQLRDTEVERDRLREQLDRHQTLEVERLAATAGLAVAKDIWLHGASLETLRADDGTIDAETVSGLVDDLVRDRPGLRAPTRGNIGIGLGAAASGRRPAEQPGLSKLLKPERR